MKKYAREIARVLREYKNFIDPNTIDIEVFTEVIKARADKIITERTLRRWIQERQDYVKQPHVIKEFYNKLDKRFKENGLPSNDMLEVVGWRQHYKGQPLDLVSKKYNGDLK